jgi:2-polyprenyl-3-methyl-5-hydroxy-6-metoxy-1,4-benzoquinol methylase
LSGRDSAATTTLPIVFENVSCMMCGSSESVPAGTTAWRGNTLAYSLCRGCGLKFMNPRPTRQWYLDFYASEFWEDKFQNKSWQEGTRFNWIWKLLKGGVSGRMRKGMKRAQLVVPELLKHVQINSTSRVLDVGCAFGLILHEIKKATGADVFGIEPNRSARAEAERRTGVEFIGNSAEDIISLKGFDGAFDLVIFSNVLENIVDPRPILKACKQLLSDNGVLYIDSPNVFYYDAMNPYHPFIYSPDTLTKLLESCGLGVRKILFEESTAAEAAASRPFSTPRPRFITLFAVKGTARPVQSCAIAAQTLLEEMALSARRYKTVRRLR